MRTSCGLCQQVFALVRISCGRANEAKAYTHRRLYGLVIYKSVTSYLFSLLSVFRFPAPKPDDTTLELNLITYLPNLIRIGAGYRKSKPRYIIYD